MNLIKCPNCGASHYQEGPSQRTAAYYPPIYRDGININPDRNTTTTKAHCLECNHDFVIIECGDDIKIEDRGYTPPVPILNVDITARDNEYVPIENEFSTSVATINLKTGSAERLKYKWELDIEELQQQVKELQDEVRALKKATWELEHPGEWYDY